LEGTLRADHNFERYLVENGIIVLKFFLNVSEEGAEEALLSAHRGHREELEVLGDRRQGAAALGRST